MSLYGVMRPTEIERYEHEPNLLGRGSTARRKPTAVYTRQGKPTTDFERAKRRAKKCDGRVVDLDGNKVVADYSHAY